MPHPILAGLGLWGNVLAIVRYIGENCSSKPMDNCIVSFPDSNFSSLTLPARAALAEYLTAQNSPILFGCRTGLCGTCLAKVGGAIPPPQAPEREVLAIYAPQDDQARLACQVELTTDIAISCYQNNAI